MAEEVWLWECEAASQGSAVSRKEPEVNASIQHIPLLFLSPFKFSVELQPAEWPLVVAFPPHDIFLETPSQTHPGTCLLDDSKSNPGDIVDHVTRYLEGFSWFHRSLELNNWSHKGKK